MRLTSSVDDDITHSNDDDSFRSSNAAVPRSSRVTQKCSPYRRCNRNVGVQLSRHHDGIDSVTPAEVYSKTGAMTGIHRARRNRERIRIHVKSFEAHAPASILFGLAEFPSQIIRSINITWAMNRSAREGEKPRSQASIRVQTEIKAKRITPTTSLCALCCLLDDCPVKQVIESDALQPNASNLESASQVQLGCFINRLR